MRWIGVWCSALLRVCSTSMLRSIQTLIDVGLVATPSATATSIEPTSLRSNPVAFDNVMPGNIEQRNMAIMAPLCEVVMQQEPHCRLW